MPGGDIIAAERLGLAPEITELEFLIAHHAWVRRPASLVFAGKIIDNESLKLVRLINNVVRNPKRVRHAAGVGYRLRPAAFVFRARDAILRPDLHGHADDIIALLAQQIARDAGVHPTAHAEQNPLFVLSHRRQKFRPIARSVNIAQITKLQHSSSKEISIIKFPNRRRAAALNVEV